MIFENVGNEEMLVLGVYTLQNGTITIEASVKEELDRIESITGVRYTEEEMDLLYEIYEASEFGIGICGGKFYVVDFQDQDLTIDELPRKNSMYDIIDYALEIVEGDITDDEVAFLEKMKGKSLNIK